MEMYRCNLKTSLKRQRRGRGVA